VDQPATVSGGLSNIAQENAFASGANLVPVSGILGNAPGLPFSGADPQLSAIADNGGPTPTTASPPDRPAMDAALCDGPIPPTDQRGFLRAVGLAPDIGAYEEGSSFLATDIIFRDGFESSCQ